MLPDTAHNKLAGNGFGDATLLKGVDPVFRFSAGSPFLRSQMLFQNMRTDAVIAAAHMVESI